MNRTKQAVALVTGATGVIGPTLVSLLKECNYQVRIFARESSNTTVLENVAVFRGDLSSGKGLSEAVAGVDTVFHLAAKLHLNDPTPDLFDEYRAINVDGTKRLITAAKNAGVRRFIFFSTINVYGSQIHRRPVQETDNLHPETIYAKTKAEAEAAVLAMPGSVILRLAAVYGPGMKGNYRRLLKALQKGVFFHIGDGLNRRTLVHAVDACRAGICAAEHEASGGKIYNVTDGHIYTMRDIVGAMSRALGKTTSVRTLPESPVRAVLKAADALSRLLGKKLPVGEATLDKLTEDMAVSGEKIRQELGFTPSVNLDDGWRDFMKQNKR